MILLIQYTLVFASVLMLVALGGCFSEHSGVINLGLEGIMVVGALGGALTMSSLPVSGFAMVIAVVLVSCLCGMLYSALLGIASIHFRADQTLVGTAMNMMAVAGSAVIASAVNISKDPDRPSSIIHYSEAKESVIIQAGSLRISWFSVIAVILLIVSFVLLYRTRFGLRLRACGEHPQAADSVGINVAKMRWAGVLISGFLGGLGGVTFITAGVSEWMFETGVSGFGFLALAVMIFGQWKPLNIALAALLFGFFRALSNVYSGFDILTSLHLPGAVYNMMPYIISLIVLIFSSKNSAAPKAEGIPYDKSMR